MPQKRLRRTRAFARTLPGDSLQFAIRMLIRWMPEERRRPARRTQSVQQGDSKKQTQRRGGWHALVRNGEVGSGAALILPYEPKLGWKSDLKGEPIRRRSVF